MKKILLTQKNDAVQNLVHLASGNRKSSTHPEWHFGEFSFIGRQQTQSTPNHPMYHPYVVLHPTYLLCNSYSLLSYLVLLILLLSNCPLYSLHLFSYLVYPTLLLSRIFLATPLQWYIYVLIILPTYPFNPLFIHGTVIVPHLLRSVTISSLKIQS